MPSNYETRSVTSTKSPRFRYVRKYQATMNERPREGSSVVEDEMAVSRCRSFVPSLLAVHRAASVMSRRIVFRLSAPDADSSFNPAAFQECECHGFLRQPVTTVSDNEDDDDLRPGDRLCTPANRYTFYALRLVCRFRFFFCVMVSCEVVFLSLNFRLKLLFLS